MHRIMFITAATMLLAGCASTANRVSCVDNDWTKIGYDTAIDGKTVRAFEGYSDKCLEPVGDKAKKSYVDGFTKGILEFCTFENGYLQGSENLSIKEVCPVEVRSAYVKGYNQGLFEYKDTRRNLRDSANRNESEMEIEESRNIRLER